MELYFPFGPCTGPGPIPLWIYHKQAFRSGLLGTRIVGEWFRKVTRPHQSSFIHTLSVQSTQTRVKRLKIYGIYCSKNLTCFCGWVVSKIHSSTLILTCLWTSKRVLTKALHKPGCLCLWWKTTFCTVVMKLCCLPSVIFFRRRLLLGTGSSQIVSGKNVLKAFTNWYTVILHAQCNVQ